MSKITRRRVLTIIAAALAAPRLARAATASILVHKDPECGCCSGWVEHLRAAGFGVTVEETTDLRAVSTRLRVPPSLASCHTAEVAGYAVEGHVPAEAVARLLAQRPNALGLAVAGMPAGSPGMDGGTPKQYDVVLFSTDGQRSFMRFVGSKSAG
jgi:hypothetical protein